MAQSQVVEKDENIQIERLELGPFATNAYIVLCRKTRASVLVDAPTETKTILQKLEGTEPHYLLLTHNHMDHVGALREVHDALSIPLAAHASDANGLPVSPDLLLNDGDTISCGQLTLDVLFTPGHTPGSLCFKAGRSLLSGDTIFPGGPGMTTSPKAFTDIIQSITTKIFTLPDDTKLYPGHGDATLVGHEKEQFAAFSSRSHSPGLCGHVHWLTS